MNGPGLRETKKEQTRLAIARAALSLFSARGFDDVSIAEIAEAAQVSKMTVSNYFPLKEDIFFEYTHARRLPDLAAAVRDRAPEARPLTAIHGLVRADLERHAEWTGLHEGSAKFARIILESPILTNGFARLWRTVETELTAALAEAHGIAAPPADVIQQVMDSLGGRRGNQTTPTEKREEILATLSSKSVRIRLAVAQILEALQGLVAINMLRQILGQPIDQAEALALNECDDAFRALSDGLGIHGF